MHGVWVDKQKTKIFRKVGSCFEEVAHFDAHPSEAGFLQIGKGNLMFQLTASELIDANCVLLLGPGLAKHHFRTYLMEQFPLVSRKVISCEQLDQTEEFRVPNLLQGYEKNKIR